MTTTPVPLINEWLRFVVLRHHSSPDKTDHYDIGLEITRGDNSDDLSLDKLECLELDLTTETLGIEPQELIRRRYLYYEGLMRGNRGAVSRVDEGIYMITNSDKLIFRGKLLRGTYALSDDGERLFIKKVSEAIDL